MDIGGDLSHGSIVLRELGIPAITNTRHGSTKIRNGDFVRVNAGNGTVQFEPKGKNEPDSSASY